MSLSTVLTDLRAAQRRLALARGADKAASLEAAAEGLWASRETILEANARDVARARAAGTREALIDRLRLDQGRVRGMAEGVRAVALLPDPVGRVLAGWRAPNGLLIERVAAPLGVVAVIYESRPNVTVEAASLAYKAGCAALLRGSSSALESNRALVAAFRGGLGVPGAAALAEGDREVVDEILEARGLIDVVVPRGGRELIRRVAERARVPVIVTGEGNCHIYVERSADVGGAAAIIDNAKTQKPGACNAVETLLVEAAALEALMPALGRRLAGRVEMRCDERALRALAAGGPPAELVTRAATAADWETEFLDYVLAVKTVDSLDEAIDHVNRYGTGHSEAILTNDLGHAEEFCRRVDAACVYVNASTRFTDGGEFGFGGELGISTQRLHVRGPMGVEALTTGRYRVWGEGQVRG